MGDRKGFPEKMITELRAKGSKELTRQRSGQSFIAEQVCRFPVMGGDKVPSKNEGARMWERLAKSSLMVQCLLSQVEDVELLP